MSDESERMIQMETKTTCEQCGAAIVKYSDFLGVLPQEDGMRSHTPLVCERTRELRQALAELTAKQADVLRLTGERDALAKKAGDVEWREDAAIEVVKRRGNQLSELTATRDLLTAENERLRKERDAAIAMEADTARRSSAEIDSLKAELNEARGEVEDMNRRVEELYGQRDEARERLREGRLDAEHDVVELRALGFGLGCMLTNARGWLQLMCHHSEQHMELRAQIETQAFLLRGGK